MTDRVVDIPTLILYGPDDHAVREDFVPFCEATYTARIGPLVVPGAGHFLQWERADIFNPLVAVDLSFLRRGAARPTYARRVAVARTGVVSMDCADPRVLAAFWASMLGGDILLETDSTVIVLTEWTWLSALKVDDYVPPTWPDGEVPKQSTSTSRSTTWRPPPPRPCASGPASPTHNPGPTGGACSSTPPATRSASPRVTARRSNPPFCVEALIGCGGTRGGRRGGPWRRWPRRRRCRSRRPRPGPRRRRGPGWPRPRAGGGNSSASMPYSPSSVSSASICMRRTSWAMAPTSALSAGRWLAAASSSTNSAVPRRSDASCHQDRSGSGAAMASAIRSTVRPARRWTTATKRSSRVGKW